MLLEKYKPSSISEFVGNKKQVLDILKWARSPKKPLLLYGPHGCGKTLAVELVAKELSMEICEFKGDMKNFITSSKQRSIFLRNKMLVVDELDLTTMRNVSDLIKQSEHLVVFIAEDPYRSFRTIRNQCKLVRFFKIRIDTMINFLRDVCEKEKIKYDLGALSQLAKICNSDVRAALIDLEVLGKEITMEKVNRLGFRLQEDSVFETLKIIFKTNSIENASLAIEKSGKSSEEILAWIAENVASEYDGEDLSNAYNYISLADLLTSRITKRQAWSLMKYYDIGAYGTSVVKKRQYRNFFIYKSPKFVAPETKGIILKISARLGKSEKKSKEYVMLLKNIVKKDTRIADEFGFDEEDMKVLESF